MAGKRRLQKVRLSALALWTHLNRHNLSQNELARQLGITSGYLSQLISGQRCPSPQLRRRLLGALGDPPFDDLFIVEDNR